MNWRNIISSVGCGIGGFTISQQGKFQFAGSGYILLGMVITISVTIIVIVFRLTASPNGVALVKAWRSNSISSSADTNSKNQEAGIDAPVMPDG